MSRPGALNRRLTLEAPVETPDGAGGVTRSYEAVATLWAEVESLSARGDVVAASFGATLMQRIVIRPGHDITTRHRLRDGALVFVVRSLRRIRGGRFIEIIAEERVD